MQQPLCHAPHLSVQHEHAAVVVHAAVHHWRADIHHDAVSVAASNELRDALPAVLNGVQLREVVLAAVARDLKLGTNLHIMLRARFIAT